MTTVKLNGKKYTCVSSYEEMKVRHFIRIAKEWDQDLPIEDRDNFKLLGILTDTEFTEFNRSPENVLALTGLLGWVIVQPFQFSTTPPKVLEIKGKVIDIPEDVSELSIGQNIHLRRDYLDKSKTLEENIAIATAIYLQPLIDGKFNIKKAIALSKEIEEMPINLIYPIGFFLLNRALKFGMPPESNWRQGKTNLSRTLKRMWRGLLRSTGLQTSTIFH
jgi:hypothetical protein